MTPALLRGVDLAAFAVAFDQRLRRAGMSGAAGGSEVFVRALRGSGADTRAELYWTARVAYVRRFEDIAAFDAVFAEVFGSAAFDPHESESMAGPDRVPDGDARDDGKAGGAVVGGAVPWVTRQSAVGAEHAPDEAGIELPDLLPSALTGRADDEFRYFDAADLQQVGRWLEQSTPQWPGRVTRRRAAHPRGDRIDLRATMKHARRTGWEPIRPIRTRARTRPRPLVLICDISRSMRPYTTVYLQFLHTVTRRRQLFRAEAYAFATTITRLTPILGRHAPDIAVDRANATVTDRYGGTHIGRCLGDLVSSPGGNALRGALVVIASDGWDSDHPEVVARAMARIRRRAYRVVWLNPRAAAPGFAPSAGAMAAALPYCDVLLPAASLNGIRELLRVLTEL